MKGGFAGNVYCGGAGGLYILDPKAKSSAHRAWVLATPPTSDSAATIGRLSTFVPREPRLLQGEDCRRAGAGHKEVVIAGSRVVLLPGNSREAVVLDRRCLTFRALIVGQRPLVGNTSDKGASSRGGHRTLRTSARPFILGVDKEGNTTHFVGNADAGARQRAAAALRQGRGLGPICRQPAVQTKHGHIVTGETFFHDHGVRLYSIDAGLSVVKSEDTFRLVGSRGDKAFRTTAFVVLASVSLQIDIEFSGAAVKGRTSWFVPAELLPKHGVT